MKTRVKSILSFCGLFGLILVGNAVLFHNMGQRLAAQYQQQALFQVSPFPVSPGITSANSTVTATLTTNQVFGTITDSAAAGTSTTPTAAAICSVLGVAGTPGFGWYWDYKNSGAGTRTVAGGTGVTLSGTGTAATVTVRQFKWVVANCTPAAEALTLQSLQTSAF